MNGNEKATLSAASRLLEAAIVPLAASGVLGFVAAIVLALGAPRAWMWWSILLLTVPAVWIGMRVRFDAGLFRDLSVGSDDALAVRLAALDSALDTLGLRRASVERPLADRVRGARRLVLQQTLLTMLQLGLGIAAAWPHR